MANLTLVIDEEVLRRARAKAAVEGTSVNAVAREAIESFAGEDEAARGLAEFLEWARNSTYSSPPDWKWDRDEIYAERMDRYGKS